MAITPAPGYQVDPTNPNGVVASGSTPSTPSPVTTTTPSPTNTNTSPTQATPAPYAGPSIVDALNSAGQASDMASRTTLAGQYGIQNYTGTADQNTQLLQKYRAGLAATQDSGKPAPNSMGDASAAVNTNAAPTPPPPAPSPVENTLKNDPGYQQLLKDQNDYLSAQSQGQSLADEYTKLTNAANIPGLNTELINSKAVIDGTENDIRNEISKSGGFATNSAIQAMAVARNKVLVQNYNNLLQTRDDAVNQINTTMGFAEKDQANATALSQEKLNFDQQIVSYEQKFTQNAQDALKNMQSTEGWDGIYKAALASGDPSAIQRINQTMGTGFDLASMAKADAATRQAQVQAQQQAQTKFASDQAQAKATLAKTNADIANTQANTAKTTKETSNIVSGTTPTTSMPYNGNYKSPTDYVNAVLSSQNVAYQTVVANTPTGYLSVIDNATGQTGKIDAVTYKKDPTIYTVMYNNTK